MKHQALLSLKDKSKQIKGSPAATLLQVGSLKVKNKELTPKLIL